jgi:hypothetical protein
MTFSPQNCQLDIRRRSPSPTPSSTPKARRHLRCKRRSRLSSPRPRSPRSPSASPCSTASANSSSPSEPNPPTCQPPSSPRPVSTSLVALPAATSGRRTSCNAVRLALASRSKTLGLASLRQSFESGAHRTGSGCSDQLEVGCLVTDRSACGRGGLLSGCLFP